MVNFISLIWIFSRQWAGAVEGLICFVPCLSEITVLCCSIPSILKPLLHTFCCSQKGTSSSLLHFWQKWKSFNDELRYLKPIRSSFCYWSYHTVIWLLRLRVKIALNSEQLRQHRVVMLILTNVIVWFLRPTHFLYLSFLYFIFNWRLIALQCCVGFLLYKNVSQP